MDPGTLLAGRYRIEAVLASGGMGVVYSAKQLPLGRSVAVKVLRRELLKHGPFLARLRREAHTAAALKHPHIVDVTDLVLEEEVAFLVMELLDGEPLGARIASTNIEPQAVATIGCQVLSALDAAHKAGLVHRDVKPDNIFLVRTSSTGVDTAKLLDFGLVKVNEPDDRLTAANAVLGTWQYMAPEQARGDEADARADVYALGACLYYALTKKRPYQAADMDASTFALSDTPAVHMRELRPDLDRELCAVIEHAIEKDPNKRWQTAREMMDALSRFSAVSVEKSEQDSLLEVETAPSLSSDLLNRAKNLNDSSSNNNNSTSLSTLSGATSSLAASSASSSSSSTSPATLSAEQSTGPRLAAISRAIEAAVVLTRTGPHPIVQKPLAQKTVSPSPPREASDATDEIDTETLPISARHLGNHQQEQKQKQHQNVRGSAATILDPGRRSEAYEPTLDVIPTEPVSLPSEELVSDIESVELHSISDSRKKWRPPAKVRVRPMDGWVEENAFVASGVAKRARLRRIGFLVAAGLFVFASGLALGQLLFK